MTASGASLGPLAVGPEGLLAQRTSSAPLRSRPRITISYAQSLDGSIAARPGEPLRLSGSRSLELTHRLRAEHDAILVGIGTVLADDPRLNVRLAAGDSPIPVILDSGLRLPLTARLLRGCGATGDGTGGGTGGGPAPLVATRFEASPERAARLSAAGVTVLRFRSSQGRAPLRSVMRALHRRGVRRLLVEGGSRVLTSMFSERLADWVVITVAPRLVGGEPALARVPAPVDLAELSWARLDDDLVFAGRPRFGIRRRARPANREPAAP